METNATSNVYRQRSFIRCLVMPLIFTAGLCLYAEDIIYIVVNGDTVYSIARKYGVKVDDILLVNGINDARKIRSGQRIRIPPVSVMAKPIGPAAQTPAAPSLKTEQKTQIEHKTQKGETLTGIARTYGITLAELQNANNLAKNHVLKTGDTLTIPARRVPPPPSASPAWTEAPSSPRNNESAVRWPFAPRDSAYISGKLSPGMVLTGVKSESVYSVSSGTVVSAGPYRGFGQVIIVKSDAGYDYFYGGCETLSVQKGDRVTPGAEVGRLGISVVTSKPQLTFMVYHNRKSIDPATAPRA